MPDDPGTASPRRRASAKQVAIFVVGLAIVVAIFAFAIPRFASYADVWEAFGSLTPLELWSLIAATIANLATYWLANMAALPGLKLWPAAVVTQTGTSVANTLPAGGAVAVGVTYAQLASWGFSAAETALYVGVTGIWNIFVKLALPVVALALLVMRGLSYPALVGVAVLGLITLAVAVTLLFLIFRSEAMARRVGHLGDRVGTAVLRPLGRGPVTGLAERAVRFRRGSILLVQRRWARLTVTTVISHLSLCLVLILSIRHMGVDATELPTVEIFAVFAFGRLLSALPITPGGAGVIELGFIGGLSALAGVSAIRPQLVAAVLLFRVLTFGVQIPIGGATYVIWRLKRSWWRESPPPGSIALELAEASASAEDR